MLQRLKNVLAFKLNEFQKIKEMYLFKTYRILNFYSMKKIDFEKK